MRDRLKYAILLITSVLLYFGCMERVDVDLSSSEYMSFRATLGEGAQVRTRSITADFEITEEEWPLEVTADGEHTKATLNNILGNYSSAGVFGYYGKDDICTILKNSQFKFDGDEMVTENPPRWSSIKQDNNESITIYAYAPRIETLASNVIPIADVSDSQIDYIAAASDPIALNSSTNTYQSIQLPFEHIYAAIQLKAGFGCTITSVSITNIASSGTYTIGVGWYLGTKTGVYTISNMSLTVGAGDKIGAPILMIPQVLAGSQLSIVTTEGTYSVSLDKKEWRQGKLITYTLNKKVSQSDQYIYFDLAADSVLIKGGNYKGYVFVNGEKKEISGTHVSGNKYYIYQSCVTEGNKNNGNYKVGYSGYDEVNKKGIGKPTLPTYQEVMYDETTRWRDFITNNSNVESVIEAWDNKYGAGWKDGNRTNDNDYTNLSGSAGAVRNAGREATKYYIAVSDEVGDITLVLDNIYTTYQEQGPYRKFGGITYKPKSTSSSRLTLNIVGDNRVGCIHYVNVSNGRNKLIFEGSGSITVADADFYQSKYSHANAVTGYYSNHFDSAIGGSDDYQNCYGIVINSGVIYAGTTQAENSTAIGGGGNGYGEVVINGGVVTAVAATTGTAIGGGIGFASNGGGCYVEINGGNVYAYNKDNGYGIPSSAIGGAGSSASTGASGTVKISNGNVYAESALGTAIGGGSSATRPGGAATIEITGGNIVAKCVAEESGAGIGGGSSYTESVSVDDTDNGTANGGGATIKISGSPIIRTGSIGGGSPGKGTGKIGSATIEIRGGDIQAQFVMAASPNNVFNMQGGLIRNSDTSDNEYKCIQENGGAVYMQQGTFTMSGGTIKKCSASKTAESKGGAVYIEGGNFTMTGGTIEQCTSNSHGGALYIEGGNVALNSSVASVLFSGNVSRNGNGGAICINGGTFEMNGENVNISNNAAIDREHLGIGNGGGVYVSSTSGSMTVGLTKGSITGNAAGRYGGGVCVINGGEDLTVNVSNIINNNNSLLEGGGLYVRGDNARVNINDGSVKHNTTSGYQTNQQIKVDGGGLVTLNKADVTDQITVTFNDNASYYGKTIEGNVAKDTETYQYLVRSNRGILSDVTPTKEGYTFSEWNTRRDGKGDTYTNTGVAVILDQDITLYAIWNKN